MFFHDLLGIYSIALVLNKKSYM